jgi:hypothetical protein
MENLFELKHKRTKKNNFKIKIDNEELNLSYGSVDNKLYPKSIYINLSFWFKLNKEIISKDFESEYDFKIYFRNLINKLFNNSLKDELKKGNLFTQIEDSIFYYDFPNNIFYSEKKCFCSIEFTFYTKNKFEDLSLFENSKENNLNKKILKLLKTISKNTFFKKNKYYSISKTKK